MLPSPPPNAQFDNYQTGYHHITGYHSDQALVKYIIILDSNTFLCLIDLESRGPKGGVGTFLQEENTIMPVGDLIGKGKITRRGSRYFLGAPVNGWFDERCGMPCHGTGTVEFSGSGRP